jgi:hypothetical protein
MEIINTIILLCQLNGVRASTVSMTEYIETKQLLCQQYYMKCLGANKLAGYKDLSKCVQERKL